MPRIWTALILAVSLALAGCGGSGGGDGGSDTTTPPPPPRPPPPPPPPPPGIETTAPVETRPSNAPNQTPAFANQTRAPGQRSQRALATSVVASGLVNPWGLTALPDGRWLITERPGRMRIVTAQGVVGAPIQGLPAVLAQGQGGLLDVELSPTFASDRLVFWSYAEPRTGGSGTAVARGRLSADGTQMETVQVIFRALPTYNGAGHYGARIVFGTDGRLFVTLGDRQDSVNRPRAQQLDSHFGKVVRINADGSLPSDNPFVGQAGALGEIWSLGHRNPQGAAVHPETGTLWEIEHGTNGGDEVNRIGRGLNYGWPDVAYGLEYDGSPIGAGLTARAGTEQPVYFWNPTVAPAGSTFYFGSMFPEWRGHLLIGALAGQHLIRLQLSADRVVGEERLLTALGARIRDVAVASDGAVWVITDETNGRLVRLSAAA